jgi:hypothetical protein
MRVRRTQRAVREFEGNGEINGGRGVCPRLSTRVVT